MYLSYEYHKTVWSRSMNPNSVLTNFKNMIEYEKEEQEEGEECRRQKNPVKLPIPMRFTVWMTTRMWCIWNRMPSEIQVASLRIFAKLVSNDSVN